MPELIAPSPDVAERWERTRLRLRMLTGSWLQDLVLHMRKHLDPTRAEAWGEPTTALNLYKGVVAQLAVLYIEPPSVQIQPEDAEALAWLKAEGVWSHHQHMSVVAIGTGECALRVGWVPGNAAAEPGLSVEVVPPHLLHAVDEAAAPGEPVELWHAIMRKAPHDDEPRWFFDVYNIRDPKRPTYQIVRGDVRDAEGRAMFEDVTSLFAVPGVYPWVYEGRPFIPYLLVHAQTHGGLWDSTTWAELVCGTLDTALLATEVMHSFKTSSWQQKYGLDVELAGLKTAGEGSSIRSEIATDESSILLFRSFGNKTGALGTFPAATIPLEMMQALKAFIAMVAANSGINPSELEKADRESGVAIQIRGDAVRRRLKTYTDTFQRTDVRYLELVSKVVNLFSGDAAPLLPTSGYSTAYPALPMTREEIEQLMQVRQAELAMGLVSRVDLLMERDPSLSRDAAMVRLTEIDLERRQYPIT